MLKGNRKLALQDFSGEGSEVTLEVNWNKYVKGAEYVKLKVGDGPEAIVKQDHLFMLLMAIAKPKQQEKMVGTMANYQAVRNYRTVVDIIAQANIQKGQRYGVPLTISFNEATGEMRVKP